MIDWDKLQFNVRAAVRFQDAVIDYTDYFLKQNREVQLNERRIGIGTMGLGTLLIMMGLRYGSDEALEFIDDLYSRIAFWAYVESINLAKEKGSFPKFEYDKFVKSRFVGRLIERFPTLKDNLKKYGIRNVTLLTQAPTGSTGTLLDNILGFNCSTGIEPYYSWEYWRAGRFGKEKQEVELVRRYREENGLSEDNPLPDYFVTAMELTPEEHVKVQAAIQKWVDSSISKTCNAPADYTVEQTKQLYELAYRLGCKGITIYRDGSREAQVLATNEEDARLESHIEAEKIKSIRGKYSDVESNTSIKKRPQRLFGLTEKVKVPIGDGQMTKVYITINVDEDTGLPVEVFINANDHVIRPIASALGRMTTQFLRFGATQDNVEQTVKHLKKSETFGSLPYQLAVLLEQIAYGKIEFGNKHQKKNPIKWLKCPSCGEEAYDKANCICHACGQSKCN